MRSAASSRLPWPSVSVPSVPFPSPARGFPFLFGSSSRKSRTTPVAPGRTPSNAPSTRRRGVRSCVSSSAASNLRSGRTVQDGWRVPHGGTPLSLLFEPLPPYQRAKFDVQAFVQACSERVLIDGATHPDSPGYEVINGCLHGPPHVCRCALPARPTVCADPMTPFDPELADPELAAMPHVFNR